MNLPNFLVMGGNNDMDRLHEMIRVLICGPVLEDIQGRRFVVTGFADDGKTALLSRIDKPAQHPMRVTSLIGIKVVQTPATGGEGR